MNKKRTEMNSSNCTFMELKYEWDDAKKEVLIVLIVPLWN